MLTTRGECGEVFAYEPDNYHTCIDPALGGFGPGVCLLDMDAPVGEMG